MASEPNKPQKDMEVREETTVEDAGRRSIWVETGFSPDLPKYLKQLNDSIVAHHAKGSGLYSFQIRLNPDANPIPFFEAQIDPSHQVVLGGYPKDGTAFLEIGNGESFINYSELGDLQHVVRELFPGKRAILHRVDEPADEDFLELTPARFGELPIRKVPANQLEPLVDYQLILEDLRDPFINMRPHSDSMLTERICEIYRFYLRSVKPPVVEKAMVLLAELFSKNPFDNPRIQKYPREP